MIELHQVTAFAPEIDHTGEYFLVVQINDVTKLNNTTMLLHTDELTELKEQIEITLKARQEAAFVNECVGCIQ